MPFEGIVSVNLLQYEIRGTVNGSSEWMVIYTGGTRGGASRGAMNDCVEWQYY